MQRGWARNCPSKATHRQTRCGHACRRNPENGSILYGVRFLVYDPVMIKVNISDAKAHFSRYLESVESGETVLLCRRNVQFAEIRTVPNRPAQARPVGVDRGMVIPASFFEPLPDDLLDVFEGGKDPG